MNWEHLFSHAKKTFYTEFIMGLAAIIFIILYFLKGRKNKISFYLVGLAMASLIQNLIAQYDIFKWNKSILVKFANTHALYFYLIAESACCLLFLSASIKSILVKKIFLTGNIIFAVYCGIYWFLYYDSWPYLPIIQNIEGFLIIGACLYYFYESFTQAPSSTVSSDSTFWTASGIMALFSVITPLFLFLPYLKQRDQHLIDNLFTINNLAYSLLFFLFTLIMFLDSKKMTLELPL